MGKYVHRLTNHPLYVVYNNMKARCYNPKNGSYYRYGGRGISVCEEWLNSFQLFYDWCISNGWAFGLKIDRVNNEDGYHPNNCGFVTDKKSCLNRSSTRWFIVDGFKLNLLQVSTKYNIPKQTLHNRLKKNTSIEVCIGIKNKTSLINHSFAHIN